MHGGLTACVQQSTNATISRKATRFPELHLTYRVVLELCYPRPGVRIVNVDDRIVLLIAVFQFERNEQRNDGFGAICVCSSMP